MKYLLVVIFQYKKCKIENVILCDVLLAEYCYNNIISVRDVSILI